MTSADGGQRPAGDRLGVPALILAADHRARGVITVELDDTRVLICADAPATLIAATLKALRS